MRNIRALKEDFCVKTDSFKIGDLIVRNRLLAAPMAGISDRPFRELCYRFGAGLTFSEMFLANSDVWHTNKSLLRMTNQDDVGIRAVQIVGNDPDEMAKTAQFNQQNGAQLIDINMGCPAKKVNKKLAGSALLQYPQLVEDILKNVVESVSIPVSLKIRTGWDKAHKNCLEIAQIAQKCGIKAIAIHGRTKACLFNGIAEYDSIKKVKQYVTIPVIANGDITTPQKALEVFQYTQADAIMIGRATQGRPWIFEEIDFYLRNGTIMPVKKLDEVKQIVLQHIKAIHQLYGEYKGIRIARKHVFWYTQNYDQGNQFRRLFNVIETAQEQFDALEAFFHSN